MTLCFLCLLVAIGERGNCNLIYYNIESFMDELMLILGSGTYVCVVLSNSSIVVCGWLYGIVVCGPVVVANGEKLVLHSFILHTMKG